MREEEPSPDGSDACQARAARNELRRPNIYGGLVGTIREAYMSKKMASLAGEVDVRAAVCDALEHQEALMTAHNRTPDQPAQEGSGARTSI